MRRKENKIDWKVLAGIDLNSFEEEIDRKRWPVYEIAEMMSNFDVDSEFDVNAIDHHFVKVFRFMQLLLKHFSTENKLMKSREGEYNKERNVIDENKKLKKLLKIYQRAFSFADIDTMNNHSQCPHCPKAFSDVSLLKNHISSRHPKNGLEAEGTFVLSKKIAEYNAALLTDSQIMKNVQKELDEIKEKLKVTETTLFQEREERQKLEEKMEMEISQKVEEIQENMKESEQLKSERVLNQLKNDFQNQLIQASLRNDSGEENVVPAEIDIKTFQQVLMMQTTEVQRIGLNIEKMVNLLTLGEQQNTVKPQNSSISNYVAAVKVEDPKEAPVPIKRSPREVVTNQSKSNVNAKQVDHNDIAAKLDEELKQIGINSNKISKDEYNEAMKQIMDSRRMKSSYKELQKLVDIKASIEMSKEEVLGKTCNDLKDIPRENNENTITPNISLSVEQKQPMKSVLKHDNGESKPKKKIRFSDKNIEISPESSDEDIEFNENLPEVKDNLGDEKLHEIDLTDSDNDEDDVFQNETIVKRSSEDKTNDTEEAVKNKPTVGELTKLIEEKLSVQTRRPGSGAVNTIARNNKKIEPSKTTYEGYESD